jgi:hypothetical protein
LASGEFGFYNYVEDVNLYIDPFGLANLNALTSKANYKLYVIYEDSTKAKILKIGKAKSDDVMPTLNNKNRRMHNSERKAKKQYPNAVAEEYRDLGYTSTKKALGMDFKINYSSKLINTNFNIKAIIAEKYLLEKTNTLYKNILPDWNIILNVIYSSSIYDSNIISISKKGITYSKDLEKHIGINIPIPLKSEQSWGIDKKNVSYQPFYDREKYNYLLEFDFSKFQNIEDCKNAAIIRGIDELFRLGFTLQGKKIQIQESKD